eukprot:486139-Prorocentrum_minimum.AAC.1
MGIFSLPFCDWWLPPVLSPRPPAVRSACCRYAGKARKGRAGRRGRAERGGRGGGRRGQGGDADGRS